MNLNRLKLARIRKGLTQKDVAEKLGYKGKSGYCHLENDHNNISLEKAIQLSNILEESVYSLISKQDKCKYIKGEIIKVENNSAVILSNNKKRNVPLDILPARATEGSVVKITVEVEEGAIEEKTGDGA